MYQQMTSDIKSQFLLILGLLFGFSMSLCFFVVTTEALCQMDLNQTQVELKNTTEHR